MKNWPAYRAVLLDNSAIDTANEAKYQQKLSDYKDKHDQWKADKRNKKKGLGAEPKEPARHTDGVKVTVRFHESPIHL